MDTVYMSLLKPLSLLIDSVLNCKSSPYIISQDTPTESRCQVRGLSTAHPETTLPLYERGLQRTFNVSDCFSVIRVLHIFDKQQVASGNRYFLSVLFNWHQYMYSKMLQLLGNGKLSFICIVITTKHIFIVVGHYLSSRPVITYWQLKSCNLWTSLSNMHVPCTHIHK